MVLEAVHPKPQVTILSGFLGSGKTTILNTILRAQPSRIAVVVNDFGAINIDARLTLGIDDLQPGRKIELTGGCVCCNIRNELTAAIRGIAGVATPPEHIIIETSGVADPVEVARSCASPELNAWAELNAILVTVDAEQLLSLEGKQRRLALRQIAVADLILLTKSDLPETRAASQEVSALLDRKVPHARRITTSKDKVPVRFLLDELPLSARAGQDDLRESEGTATDSHSHHDHGAAFESWHFSSDKPLNLGALRKTLARLPPSIYRAKGILHTTQAPERAVIMQLVGRRAELSLGHPWGDQHPRNDLVLVGAPGTLDREQLAAQFSGCEGNSDGGALATALGWFQRKMRPTNDGARPE